jgi:hypothetical protein
MVEDRPVITTPPQGTLLTEEQLSNVVIIDDPAHQAGLSG